MTDDLLQRADPFLEICGSCELGMPTCCTCPTGDYRPVMLGLYREVQRLRELITALPHTSDQLFAWLREHDISLSPGPGVVLTAVRADLMRAAGIAEEGTR